MNTKIDCSELQTLLQERKALSGEIARLEALRDGLISEENALLESVNPEDLDACAKLSAIRSRIDIFPSRIAKLEADAAQLDAQLRKAAQLVRTELVSREIARRESAIRLAGNALAPFSAGEPLGQVIALLPVVRNLGVKIEALAFSFDRDATAQTIAENVLLEVSR
jgi:hypothetical protein